MKNVRIGYFWMIIIIDCKCGSVEKCVRRSLAMLLAETPACTYLALMREGQFLRRGADIATRTVFMGLEARDRLLQMCNLLLQGTGRR